MLYAYWVRITTLDKLIADGYDTKLTAFEYLIPALITNFEKY
jgi:hypothetical protein